MLLTSRCDSFICFDRSTSVAFGQQENVGKYARERERDEHGGERKREGRGKRERLTWRREMGRMKKDLEI